MKSLQKMTKDEKIALAVALSTGTAIFFGTVLAANGLHKGFGYASVQKQRESARRIKEKVFSDLEKVPFSGPIIVSTARRILGDFP